MDNRELLIKYLENFAFWNSISMENFLAMDPSLNERRYYEFRKWFQSKKAAKQVKQIFKDLESLVIANKEKSIERFETARNKTKARLPRLEDFNHVGMFSVSKSGSRRR